MVPVPPLPDQPFADPVETVVDGPKPRSSKQFFLTSSARLAIGLGVLGAIGLGVWLARNVLAETGLNAFLQSKGISSAVTIENLQLGTAHIRDLRLGPVDKPDLVAKSTSVTWHIDSKSRMVVIERLHIADVQVRLGLGNDGKLEFGTLAPFLKPNYGPKRSVVNNVTLSNAMLLLETPLGQASARLNISGGETAGWTGRADMTPPASMIAKVGSQETAFSPIPIGFSIQQRPQGSDGAPPTTLLGFAVRPNGQNLTYNGYAVMGVIGDVTGQVALQKGNTVRIDTRPSTLTFSRVVGPNLDFKGISVTTSPIFWSQAGAWQSTGWGNLSINGTLDSAQIANPRLTTGVTRFAIGAARAQSGKAQIDYQGDLRSLAGSISGARLVATGNVSTTLKDLTAFAKADLIGKVQVFATSLSIPPALRASVSATAPEPILKALAGSVSGSGSVSYRLTPAQSAPSLAQLVLDGPLILTSSTGGRASWSPDGLGTPSLVVKTTPNGGLNMSGLGAGRVAVAVPGLLGLQGQIDGASFGDRGWAFIGRDMNIQSLALTSGLDASLRLERFNLAAPTRGLINGAGVGEVLLRTNQRVVPGQGNARLNFDLRASPQSISGSLQGPIDGLGGALGLGGYGVRDGRLNVTGAANRRGAGWQIDARGGLAARTFDTNAAFLVAPTTTLTANGRISDAGDMSARAVLTGSASSARAGGTNTQSKLGSFRFDTNATLEGRLDALKVAGSLKAALAEGTFSGLKTQSGINDTTFSGIINPDLIRITGNQSTRFARLSRLSGPADNRIDVAGIRASGPFSVQTRRQGQSAPFWDDRLTATGTSLTTVLALDAASLRAGGTSLTNVRVSGPVLLASNGPRWQGSADLAAAAKTFGSGDTQVNDMLVSGPVKMSGSSGAWQSSADIRLAASRFSIGETRLNGLLAAGPLSVTSNIGQQIKLASARCLDFNARSGTFPGDASVGPVSGKLCPDSGGQLAIMTPSTTRLFASTQFEPFAIQIGDLTSGQRIELGQINGKIATKTDGSLGIEMLASQFGLSLALPDGTTAQIKANEAALDISPGPNGVALKGRIGQLSSTGLPVRLSGGATADLLAGAQGLAGTFNFDDILVKDGDTSMRFGDVRLVGSGTLAGNQVSILSDVLEPASELKMATILLSHDIATGSGNVDFAARDLLFSPMPVGSRPGLEIITLIPPLRGVVSDMVGVVNASANIAWSRNMALVSRANIATKGLNFGTQLGPVSGLSGDIVLDDILLVRTPGRQTIKVGLFDPGLPVENGTVQLVLPGNNTLRLEDASWPFAEGKLSVRPATWAFRDGDQSFAIDVDDVDLAKLLRLTEVPNLEIDGKVSGVFPIEVRNGNVEIVGGRLKAREGGGVIRYTGPNPSPPPPPPGFWGRQRQRILGKPQLGGADLAVAALRALEYKILEITVDGRITGELQMGIILEGANQQVLSGQPFKFNVKMNVPVGQLLDNLNRLNNSGSSPEVLQEIDRVLREEAARDAARSATPIPPPPVPPLPVPQPSVPQPPEAPVAPPSPIHLP